MKKQYNLDPVIAMHSRLNLFKGQAPALAGSFEVGSYHDPNLGRVDFREGALSDFVANSQKPFSEEEAMEVAYMYRQASEEASMGRTDLQRTLNSMRVTQVDNYVRAMGNWTPFFFEQENLLHDERPVFVHTSKSEVDVHYLAEDGTPNVFQAVRPQSEVYPALRTLTSETVDYQLEDVYNGDIATPAQRTFDIGFDINAQIEKLAFDHMTASAYGSFTTSGSKVARTYVGNSHLTAAGNLPSTNELAVSGIDASSKLDEKALLLVRKYCDQWANAFPDGPLSPTGVVLIASSDTTNWLEKVNPFGAKVNSLGEGVLENYLAISYGNTNWILVPDVTLAPNIIYPVLNKKLGKVYFKPSMDREFLIPSDPAERIRLNKEGRYQKKVIGMAHAASKRVNVCRVRYRNDS